MRVGSAFDIQVKAALGAPVHLDDKIDEEARMIGEIAYRGYRNSGAFDELPDGIVPEPALDAPKKADWDGIIIAGFPDAMWRNDETCGILDWKVSGAYSESRKIPKGEFFKVWNSDGMSINGNEWPMHEINGKWASQLTFYGVIEGLPAGEFKASIDQLLMEKDSELVVIARYMGLITPDFAKSVWDRCNALWTALEQNKVVNEDLLPTTDLATLSLMV